MASPASVSRLSRDTATWKQSSSLSLPPIGSWTSGRNKRRGEEKKGGFNLPAVREADVGPSGEEIARALV